MQNKLRKIVHKKERQKLDDLISNTGAGTFFVKDPKGVRKTWLLVYSAVLQYIYNVEEDGLVQIPSMALAGAFGAWACGSWGRWSNAITATTWGTTTSVTTTTSINNLCVGKILRFATGANAGKDVTVTDVKIIPWGTNTIYFTGSDISAPANGDTFRVDTGIYYVLNAYAALAAWVFKSYDPLTWVVTTLQQTNLPAAWGTEGRLVGNPSYFDPFSTGTASAWSTTTTLVTAKTWTANQRSNSQVRITGGTGIWQVRTISSNTTNTLTVSAWTVTPDNTSTYAIEGNDDFLYLLGSNAVTLYRYQISTNTWSTITPTVARAAAMGSWGGANWIAKTWNAQRADETNILDGRFIYSFRGAWTVIIDRYDIALNTWTAITHIQNAETFTTWSCYDVDGPRIYAKKESTGRYFYYDVTGNVLMPFARNVTAEGAAIVGDKMFTVDFVDGADSITYLYTIFNTSNLMYRMLVI